MQPAAITTANPIAMRSQIQWLSSMADAFSAFIIANPGASRRHPFARSCGRLARGRSVPSPQSKGEPKDRLALPPRRLLGACPAGRAGRNTCRHDGGAAAALARDRCRRDAVGRARDAMGGGLAARRQPCCCGRWLPAVMAIPSRGGRKPPSAYGGSRGGCCVRRPGMRQPERLRRCHACGRSSRHASSPWLVALSRAGAFVAFGYLVCVSFRPDTEP